MSIKNGKKRKNKKKDRKKEENISAHYSPFVLAFKHCKYIIKMYKKKPTDKPRSLQVRCKICTFFASLVAPVHISL